MVLPDASAVMTGPCGETMGIYLRLNGDVIQEATFLTNGCTPAVAYANLLTTLVEGKSVQEAGKVEPQDLIRELLALLDEHDHCAKLAINTLREALGDHPGD
jgi:nitrogen fixation NifU-like protein